MEPALVASVAFFASALTLYSGFGLGTLLLPVFALFFPVEVAVGATAVVHGANNAFKVAVVGKHANLSLVTRFGIPAVAAAFAGAAALGWVAHFGEIAEKSQGMSWGIERPSSPLSSWSWEHSCLRSHCSSCCPECGISNSTADISFSADHSRASSAVFPATRARCRD